MGSQQTSQRVIGLPGPVTGLAGDNTGTAYLSTRGGYFVVDLSAGHVTTRSVRDAGHVELQRDQPSLRWHRGAGHRRRTAVPACGRGDRRQPDTGSRPRRFALLLRAIPSRCWIAGRRRSPLSARTAESASRCARARARPRWCADPAGRLLVTDTRGDQLLVFGVDPLMLRQAYPVAESPYGVAGSRGLAWVSQTSTNSVVGYDLSTGIPLEKVRYPSVRQPNSLAFDDAAGTLYVVSGAGEGVQIIEHAAAGPR